jgi:cyclic pyranopterin phosphate synthase
MKRVNISLDSLKEDVFFKITGGSLNRVLEAVNRCLDFGIRVKINMVPISGINDDEILDFVNLTKNMDIDVRFIELMPIGPGINYTRIENSSIMKLLGKFEIDKVDNLGGGPSQVFSLPGYRGRIGFISPMSHNFCSECNRIRITSDGKLKTCLHNPGEVDLIPAINDEEQLREVLFQGITNKYKRHTMDVDKVSRSNRKMVGIGG